MNRSGLSLLELLVAMCILAIGIVGAMKLNLAGFWSARKSRVLSSEVTWARSAMEQVMAADFDELEGVCDEVSGRREIAGEVFSVNCQVVQHSDKLKQVLIMVAGRTGVYSTSVFRAEGD